MGEPGSSDRALCLQSACFTPTSFPPDGRLLPAFFPERQKLQAAPARRFPATLRYRGGAGWADPDSIPRGRRSRLAIPLPTRREPRRRGLKASPPSPLRKPGALGAQRSPHRLGQGGRASWLGGVAGTSRERVWGARRTVF